MNEHLAKHGDGVKDVAFEVDDMFAIMEVNFYPCLHEHSKAH
jgi:hypothetical protein